MEPNDFRCKECGKIFKQKVQVKEVFVGVIEDFWGFDEDDEKTEFKEIERKYVKDFLCYPCFKKLSGKAEAGIAFV